MIFQAPGAGIEFKGKSTSIRGIKVYAGVPGWNGYIETQGCILGCISPNYWEIPIVYTDSCYVTASPTTIPVGECSDITITLEGIKDANGETVPDNTPIRIDGAINGKPAIDSIKDRFFTINGCISNARCLLCPSKEGTIAGSIWSAETNWYYGTERLKYLGSWIVSVVK